MKDISCSSFRETALVLCYASEEAMMRDFTRFEAKGFKLARWKSNQRVPYPFWLECSLRYEREIYAIGHNADDVEHPEYEGVNSQATLQRGRSSTEKTETSSARTRREALRGIQRAHPE